MAQLATFDTYKYIKELTASGFDEKQAEVIIKSILEGRDYDISNLATKEQLTKIEARLEKQIASVKSDLEKQIATLDNKIENTKIELRKDIATLDNKIDIVKHDLSKDIETTKQELRQEIDITKSQLEIKVEQSKNTIVMWLITLLSPIYISALIVLVRWFMNG